jgi:hypothetical protein
MHVLKRRKPISRHGSGKKPMSNFSINKKKVIQLVAISKNISQIVAVSQRRKCHLFNIALTYMNARI